jgi:PAS domain S-box-containing protein
MSRKVSGSFSFAPLLRRVTHAGLREDTPPALARRILITNQVSLTIFFVTVPYIFIFLSAGASWHALGVVYISAAYLLFIAANRAGRYDLSRLWMILHFNSAVFLYAGFFGEASGIQLCFFALACMPLVLFEATEVWKLAYGMLLPVAGYVALGVTRYSLLPHYELSPSSLQIVHWAIVTSNFIMIGSQVLYLHYSNAAAEKELRRQRDFAQAILDTTDALIIVQDLSGNLERFNGACERTTGYTFEEVAKLPLEDRKYMDPDTQATVRKSLRDFAQGKSMSGRMRVFHRNGQPRWVDWTGTALRDAEKTRVLLTGIDVTEEVLSAGVVSKQQVQLLAASKMSALGEMASGVAHEINNPLTVIQLKAGQLQEAGLDGRMDPERVRGHAAQIESMVERISKIIASMRTFAREGLNDPMHEVSISQVVDDTLTLCQERFRSHGVDLRLSLPDPCPAVRGRVVQLSQVLLNLLNNAFDSVCEREQERRVTIQCEQRPSRVALSVLDNGGGVPDSIRPRIFDPFFTTKPPGKGTGLGLSISKAIIEAHGGTLTVESSGPGAKFIVDLPVAR